jgi:hypothetical protein
MSVLPDRLLRSPPIQFLSTAIPVGDDVAHIADKNRVTCEIEQARLLGSNRNFLFEFVVGLQKVSLNTATDRAEPGEQ